MRAKYAEAGYLAALVRTFTLAISAALAGVPFSSYGCPAAGRAVPAVIPAPETVWELGDRSCKQSKALALEILLEEKSIYTSHLLLCRAARGEKQSNSASPRLFFSFTGGHTFQGLYRTKRADKIKGNIWQAGGDSDGVLLGISFSSKGKVLLNSIHLVNPDRLSESRLDPRLIVKTRPIS